MNQDFHCRICQGELCDLIYSGIKDWEYGVEGSWDYVRCQLCSAVQLHPFPDLNDLQRAYDIDYHGYSSGEERGFLFSLLYNLKERLFRRRMSAFVGPDSRVLDVGCGAGEFLLGLQSLGAEYLEGIDFSAAMIERLHTAGLKGYAGTFDTFPGRLGSYDLVAMNNYLEHTLAPDEELALSFGMLTPGGHLVGEVPGFNSPDRWLFGRYWGGNHVPRHTFQFTASFLSQRLAAAGFENIHISHQLNPSHWALSVQNFMQRRAQDLRHNPAVVRGRSRWYLPLLLALAPLSALSALCRRSSCIKFYARKPGGKI